MIVAEVDSDRVLPLYQELYSQKAPDFKSENTQILAAIDRVHAAGEGRGIWVIDRDVGRAHMLLVENFKDRFIELVKYVLVIGIMPSIGIVKLVLAVLVEMLASRG